MSIRRFSTTALAVVLSLTFATAPVMANPRNGMAMVTETEADRVTAAIMVTGILVTPVTMVINKITVRITP